MTSVSVFLSTHRVQSGDVGRYHGEPARLVMAIICEGVLQIYSMVIPSLSVPLGCVSLIADDAVRVGHAVNF